MIAALLVGVFGGAGAALRFVVDGELRRRWRTPLPVATVAVNVSGSLLLGLLTGAHLLHGFGSVWFTAASTGLCGGYTTFSTACVETVRLVQAGRLSWAVANALGTLGLTVGAAALGYGLVWLTV